MAVILSANSYQEREKVNFPKSLQLSASSIIADTCFRSLSEQTVHRDRDFTERWLIRDFCLKKKKKKHPVIFVSSTQTIDPHEEESSVCARLWTQERSWQETQSENLWERHVNVRRWDGESLTFPSTPTPQSASWIMLTSFPPSPKRKQKPWRCQDSHQWFTNTNC